MKKITRIEPIHAPVFNAYNRNMPRKEESRFQPIFFETQLKGLVADTVAFIKTLSDDKKYGIDALSPIETAKLNKFKNELISILQKVGQITTEERLLSYTTIQKLYAAKTPSDIEAAIEVHLKNDGLVKSL